MLRWLGLQLPHRSAVPNYINIPLDNGKSKVTFNSKVLPCVHSSIRSTTGSNFLVTNHLPPASPPPANPNTPNSSLCPPFHIHLKEDETFHIVSGTAKFLLLHQHFQQSRSSNRASSSTKNGVTAHLAAPGTTITIPRGQIHTFRNASTAQPLYIEFGFSSPVPISTTSTSPTNISDHDADAKKLNTKMHRFFLNTQLYRSDCTTQNIPRSLLQALLFNHYADIALVPTWLLTIHRHFPPLRSLIERLIAPALGRTMNVLGGVVLGKWLFGLKASYTEYYPYDLADGKDPEKGANDADAKAKVDLKTKQEGKP